MSFCEDTQDVHYNPYVDPYNGHEYVEIGGLKWATMNVGATGITDTGLYFQWGDTQGYTADQVGSSSGKKPFYWDDYKYFTVDTSQEGDAYDSGKITKYNSIDGKTVLDIEDDAARANMGGEWRMPTAEEIATLTSVTTSQWTTINGVNGRLLTDKTDSSRTLFFPAVGYCYYGSVNDVGSYGNYWSSSLNASSVALGRDLDFNSGNCFMNDYDRYYGYAVRGVVG